MTHCRPLVAFLHCLTIALVTACSTHQPVVIDKGKTLGDLPAPDTPSAVPDSNPDFLPPTEALAQYEALLREETDPRQRAVLAQRAAELRLELAIPVSDNQAGVSEQAAASSIALLQTSLSDQPGTAGNDEILYQMARGYELAGDRERALASLSRLITEHPRSSLYAEALFRRAEAHFVNADYRKAEADYILLLNRQGQTSFAAAARHKLAWAIFKQGRYREALDRLLSLLDEQLSASRLSADGSSLQLSDLEPASRERLQDSVRVTVLCYALLGGAQHIPPSLRGHRSEYQALLYLKLSALYAQRGHSREASDILASFIRQQPQHAAVTIARQRMLVLLDQSGDQQTALRARASFANARLDSTDPDTRLQLRQDLLYLTRHYHAQAQNADANAYPQAKQWYLKLLKAFPDEHEQRYLMAELMLDHGDYPQAAQAFETLGYDTPGFERAAEAAYAGLLARRNSNAEVVRWSQRFVERFPQHPESSKLLALMAEQQFAKDDYRAALATAQQVLDRQVALPQQLAMLSLQTHALFKLEDYAAAESNAARWLTLATVKHPEHTAINNLQASSIYRQAQRQKEAAATQPQAREAALALFSRLRSVAPADINDPAGKLRASGSLQAAQLLLNAEQWSQAISTLEALRQAFPKHPQKAEIARGLALAYEKQGDRQRAAAEYQRFSQATDDPELQRAAAYQTAELHWQTNRLEAARDAFRDYANRYPRPLDRNLQAQQRLAEVYARLHDKRQRYWLKKIIETHNAAGDARTDLSRSYAAHAALGLADLTARSYRDTPLNMPLEQGIARKQKALETALSAYAQAADYSVASVTTAASFHIAELYRDFGRALLNAPLSKSMPTAEREEMTLLLEEQAFPFEEKAIQIHETNISRHEQGLFDAWIDKSLNALMELVPGRYAKREQGERIVEQL